MGILRPHIFSGDSPQTMELDDGFIIIIKGLVNEIISFHTRRIRFNVLTYLNFFLNSLIILNLNQTGIN